MLKTVAVLIAGELYILPVTAKPVTVDLPGLAEVKAMLAQHSDETNGIYGAVCVDFSAQGSFQVADDGGNDDSYPVAEAIDSYAAAHGGSPALSPPPNDKQKRRDPKGHS